MQGGHHPPVLPPVQAAVHTDPSEALDPPVCSHHTLLVAFQVQQCSTVTRQECRTVDEGYYQTKCTTTTVTSIPSSVTTVSQGGDNCQYKWEGKGDNMR